MSNGKKWREGQKVKRIKHSEWYHVGGKNHNKTSWWFRAKIKHNKYGDDVTHLSMRRPMSIEIWNWD